MSTEGNVASTKLNELGAEIDELRLSLRRTVVTQAAEIGQRLLQAKRLCRHGKWLPWLTKRRISERSAQNYMKIADKIRELATANPKRHSDFINLTYTEALLATRLEDKPPSPAATDELSAKRRFEKNRAEEIDRLADRLHRASGRYGNRAAVEAINRWQASPEGAVMDEVTDTPHRRPLWSRRDRTVSPSSRRRCWTPAASSAR